MHTTQQGGGHTHHASNAAIFFETRTNWPAICSCVNIAVAVAIRPIGLIINPWSRYTTSRTFHLSSLKTPSKGCRLGE